MHGPVLEAEDGAQDLTLVEAHCQAGAALHPLPVLLDLNMPVMDGLEFLEWQAHLLAAGRQLMTIIVVSATPSADERERAQALATDIKRKPLDVHQLADLLRQYLPAALPS